jgi:RNA polymerase sigma factor (sigma-70 family)
VTSTGVDRLEDHVRWATEQALSVVMAQRTPVHRDDAVAEGLRAMCLAWRRYNPARGDFEPYAREWVIGAVRRFLKQDRRLRAVEILSDCAEDIDAALYGPGDAWARLTRAVREGADAVALTTQLAEAAVEPERDEDLAKEMERLDPAELKLFDLRYRLRAALLAVARDTLLSACPPRE